MFTKLKSLYLALLKVPPEPTPPAGSPGSLRVFRAARNYLYFRMVLWAGAQTGAIFGIIVSIVFIREVELQIQLDKDWEAHAAASEIAMSIEPADTSEESGSESLAAIEAERAKARNAWREEEAGKRRSGLHQFAYDIAPRGPKDIARHIPEKALPWIRFAEFVGLIGYAVQLVLTFIRIRLDYELRWYMVTDRSLRLRSGVVNIQESTMSFANLQQVSVRQGPLQRLLRIADVEVQSAGGGSGGSDDSKHDSMHQGRFHGVDNAPEIRDLILTRLKRFRQAGLGDPDEQNLAETPDPTVASAVRSDAIVAARELLAELRDWRESINSG